MVASTASWEEVHEAYSRKGLIDPNAPVQAAGEITITASPETVWAVLTDVAGWPEIRSDIHDVTPGSVAPDSSFTWSTAGVGLVSRYGRVDPPHEVTWSTATARLVMTHRYVLERVEDGTTSLKCQEAMTAPAAPQIGNDELRARILSWLEGIKAVAESRPGRGSSI
ncbi:SRPBCC family protein [Chelativorans sp.]|uniref:SRPBCC family protein n=1 Tax=Chelativorans sp. TaxID=2203393 RepID=UPI0028115F9A|nr:SRPBCC family protein [Chelativorans sp.]